MAKPSVLITGASSGIGVLVSNAGMNAPGGLGPKGVYVQAVLPAATRTGIWERSGKDVNQLPAVMEAGELVDAALAGFDREPITFPWLLDAAQWTSHESSRQVMIPNFNQVHPAGRYRQAA